MSMIVGAFCPRWFVEANARTRLRLAETTAGWTVADSAVSKAPAMAAAWLEVASAWAAAALSQLTYWVATAIIAEAEGPCHEPLARSDATEKNEDADEVRFSASPSQASAAACSGADPGPA